jgi:hypothetical protein
VRDADLTVRWWPASGIDVALSGGYRWVEDAAHVAGADRDGARATLSVRLVR